jgi:hypothetical protein
MLLSANLGGHVKTELKTLEDCLDRCMVGGNHIASNLRAFINPTIYKTCEEAQKGIAEHFPHTWIEIYEQWCCWHCLMEAREAAEKILGREIASTSP